jgi:diaminohydroxyphosphoribosylaminopyrimidine deaminase/5-amino-6-(5-phosphoribosylamino)uracil reductase
MKGGKVNLNNDIHFMRLAIEEARKGEGRTAPNPCVGAVITKNNRIIAKGYHKQAGTPHAEINAIASAKESLAGSTMYVTLEPCSHRGRTGPCVEAIVEKGIARVVIGMTDPNPLVNGRGISYLRKYGVEVLSDVCNEECREINRPFIKHIHTGLPYVIMKAGISLDGKLNYRRGQSGWMTGKESREAVHTLRNRIDSIMVGRGTIEIDDPSLTTRLANQKGRDPLRIILDTNLRISPGARIFQQISQAETWIFCSEKIPSEKTEKFSRDNVEIKMVACRGDHVDLQQVFKVLGKAGICSVLVEGGAKLHGALLAEKLFDYAYLFLAPVFAGEDGI